MAVLGESFLVESGPSGRHLFFVISGPSQIQGYGEALHVVTVCVCSIPESIPYDNACLVHPGEHPFIQHDSYVAYRHMRIDPTAHVDRMVEQRVWVPHEACPDALRRRIAGGICASRLTPREFKRLFDCP